MAELKKPGGDIRQGLDIQKYRAFRHFAAENPEAVMFGLEASGSAEGRAVHTHARTGAYTLGGQRIDRAARQHSYHFGAHREVEEALGFVDPTDREQETEVALAALAGCINAVVTVSAAERGSTLRRCARTLPSRGIRRCSSICAIPNSTAIPWTSSAT